MPRMVRPSWLLLLVCASCVRAPVTIAPPPAPPPAPALPWYGDLHALANEAARVREVTLTQRFEVVPLDDDAFFAAYASLLAASSGPLQQELEATLREFTGADFEALKRSLTGRWNDVRQEQLIAFYHFASHRLLVRQVIPPLLAAGGERLRALTLAHEVGHVLQDQLGVGAWSPASFDDAIAQRAVLEGDATLTATLLDAERQGLPPKRAVERGRLTLGLLTTAQVLEVSGLSPKLLEAPPVVRELYLFPYFRGQRFIADLYQSGGLPLVAHALAHPPRRSDAIYAPQRWLDGSAAPLQPLGEPPRRLGLLLLRTLIEQCQQRARVPAPSLAWAESHYVDDSFRRAGSTLSWATAWDFVPTALDLKNAQEAGIQGASEEAAGRLNRAVGPLIATSVLKCLGAPADELELAVSGEVIGVVAGAPSADRQRLASAAARSPRLEVQPAMPGQRIPEPQLEVAFRPVGQGVQHDEAWTHAKLGLSMAVPGGKVMDNPGAALTVTAPGSALFVIFVDEPPTTKGDDGFVNAVLDGFLRSSKLVPEGVPLTTRHRWSPTTFAWTTGRETKGEFEGPTALHALVFPVCDGKASINVVSMGFTPSGQRRLERWVATLQGAARPPVCSDR